MCHYLGEGGGKLSCYKTRAPQVSVKVNNTYYMYMYLYMHDNELINLYFETKFKPFQRLYTVHAFINYLKDIKSVQRERERDATANQASVCARLTRITPLFMNPLMHVNLHTCSFIHISVFVINTELIKY